MNTEDVNLSKEEDARSWHPNYDAYTEMIVNHPNYKGLFYERDRKTNRVKWVVTGKSDKGKMRTAWWDKKCIEYGIPIKAGCYAIISRLLHPTGKHVCQCCGKEMSIYYEYPTKNLLAKLNAALDLDIEYPHEYSISEIVDNFCETQQDLDRVAALFRLSRGLGKEQLKKQLADNFYNGGSKLLSPGVMSNNPDRFDGFHSDGLCCRERTDKGRHSANMKTYTQDRRAYEEWADGNYNLANRLMGEFHKDERLYECPKCHEMKRMTADHTGPISLGFCHSIYFSPLCDSCNSSKNNRFTKEDIEKLIRLEEEGHTVISWHSKSIWDRLKNQIDDDAMAKDLSSVMAAYHQNVLYIFGIIYYWTGTYFLDETNKTFLDRYLHPEYSMYDYRFENFDPFHLEDLVILEEPLDSKNKRKNQDRYRRIAYESLLDFRTKDNRRVAYHYEDNSPEVQNIIELIRQTRVDEAHDELVTLLDKLAVKVIKEKWDY